MPQIRLYLQQADGGLPMVCMRCGAPATVVKVKKLSWFPWAIFVRKSAMLRAPLCEKHRSHWGRRLLTRGLITTIAIPTVIGIHLAFVAVRSWSQELIFDLPGLVLTVASSLVIAAWVVALGMVHRATIRPSEITSTHILLNGVCDAFVVAVEEAEIERRVRLRQMQEEDEIDRPRRVVAHDVDVAPPRPKASDAIEEERPRRAAPPGAIEE